MSEGQPQQDKTSAQGRIIEGIKCTHCGAQNESYRKSCYACGQPLNYSAKTSNPQGQSSGVFWFSMLIIGGFFAFSLFAATTLREIYSPTRVPTRTRLVPPPPTLSPHRAVLRIVADQNNLNRPDNRFLSARAGEPLILDVQVDPRGSQIAVVHLVIHIKANSPEDLMFEEAVLGIGFIEAKSLEVQETTYSTSSETGNAFLITVTCSTSNICLDKLDEPVTVVSLTFQVSENPVSDNWRIFIADPGKELASSWKQFGDQYSAIVDFQERQVLGSGTEASIYLQEK